MIGADMTQQNRGERVPLALVVPHVQAWIDAYYGVSDGEAPPRIEHPYVDPEDIRAEHPEWGNSAESLPILTLADASGLAPATVGDWLRRGEGTIGYFDADALFTAMDMTGLWSQDPELRAVRDAAIEAAA